MRLFLFFFFQNSSKERAHLLATEATTIKKIGCTRARIKRYRLFQMVSPWQASLGLAANELKIWRSSVSSQEVVTKAAGLISNKVRLSACGTPQLAEPSGRATDTRSGCNESAPGPSELPGGLSLVADLWRKRARKPGFLPVVPPLGTFLPGSRGLPAPWRAPREPGARW